MEKAKRNKVVKIDNFTLYFTFNGYVSYADIDKLYLNIQI
jgi:hypothetical protein